MFAQILLSFSMEPNWYSCILFCYTQSISSGRVIFLKFFASILGGYRNFIVCEFPLYLYYLFTPFCTPFLTYTDSFVRKTKFLALMRF